MEFAGAVDVVGCFWNQGRSVGYFRENYLHGNKCENRIYDIVPVS